MGRPKLEVRVKEKTLTANGRSLELHESFFYCGVLKVLNVDEMALELKYQRDGDVDSTEEGARVYEFLGEASLREQIEVSSGEDDYPTVALTGDFDPIVRK